MIRRIPSVLGLIGVVTTLAGCAGRDPYQRDDVWYPTGSNAANLAAMVVNPHDLVVGRSSGAAYAAPQVKAVERVQTDTPKPLYLGGSAAGGGGTQSGAAATAPGGG